VTDKDNKPRGFSGLSDLASDLGSANEAPSPQPSGAYPKPTRTETAQTAEARLEREAPGSPKLVGTNDGEKKTHSGIWWLLVGILVVASLVVLVSLVNLLGGESATGATQGSPSVTISPPTQSAASSTLLKEIETGKWQLSQYERQLQDMENRLDEQERTMDSYLARGMIDQYNNLARSYNSLLAEYDTLYDRYSRLVGEVNAKVDLYNRGVR
jgi:hypothetical protein